MISSFASAPPSNEFADARTPLFPDGLRMRARLVSRRVSAPSSDPNRAEVPV
jgi:hypothetical protein